MNKKYVISKYNIYTRYHEDYILFNTRTLALGLINKETKKILEENKEILLNNKDVKELQIMEKNGFIISESEDEIGILKERYWNNRFNQETLFLSIMTTLNCNFRCPYCFEKRKIETLNHNTQEGIITFIEKNIKQFKKIHVDWYGGEPLLEKNILTSLSHKIIQICNNASVEYSASITTNGYLLDTLTKEQYNKYKIKSLQVTLDGNKTTHDRRRALVNGGGTFCRIVENLKQVPKDVVLNVRVNVDQDNVDNIKSLLLYLKNQELMQAVISIKAVVSSEQNPYEDKMLTNSNYTENILSLYDYADKLGFKTVLMNPLKYFKNEFCIVDLEQQFIISPNGGVFKCGESYDDDDPSKIGKLDKEGDMKIDNDIFIKWVKDPFEEDRCKNCRVLPLCWGGCQLKRNVKKSVPCFTEYKENIDAILIMYYEMLRENLLIKEAENEI